MSDDRKAPPLDGDEMLSVSRVARRLGLSSADLYELINDNLISPHQERGTWWFRRRDVDAWIARTNWPHDADRPPEWPSTAELLHLDFASIDPKALERFDIRDAYSDPRCIPVSVVDGRLVLGFSRPPSVAELEWIQRFYSIPIEVARVSELELVEALKAWDASIIEPEIEVVAKPSSLHAFWRDFEREAALPPLEDLVGVRFFELRVLSFHMEGYSWIRLVRDRDEGPLQVEFQRDEVGGRCRDSLTPVPNSEALWSCLTVDVGVGDLPAEENVNIACLDGDRPHVQVLLDGRVQYREYVQPWERRTPSARRIQRLLRELRELVRVSESPAVV